MCKDTAHDSGSREQIDQLITVLIAEQVEYPATELGGLCTPESPLKSNSGSYEVLNRQLYARSAAAAAENYGFPAVGGIYPGLKTSEWLYPRPNSNI